MTNNPKKMKGLEGYGIEIVERVPIQIAYNDQNEFYLRTKQTKMQHLLDYDHPGHCSCGRHHSN